jgi:hypothetical protein
MNLPLLVESCQLLVGGVRVHLVFLVGFMLGAVVVVLVVVVAFRAVY